MSDLSEEDFLKSLNEYDAVFDDCVDLEYSEKQLIYFAEKYHKYRQVNLLNDALNKALIGKQRIKGIPDSNKIAEFVNEYLKQTKT